MRFFFAVLIGRIIRMIGRPLHRSTNLPGEVALKICPDFFKKLRFKGKVLAVTGSNGKTTTANLTAHILRKNGYSVLNNTEGSNLTGGIATTLLCHCKMNGYVDYDFCVFEVDERWARFIFNDMRLDAFLINNLLRDQVVRNGNPDIVKAKIAMAIRPGVTLVLNAGDPISQTIAPDNPRVYFGMDRTSRSTDECVNITHDAKVCPKCFHRLDYEFFHYNHIGKFSCSNCGFKSPEPDFFGTDVDFEHGTMKINGEPVSISYITTFYFYNTIAATALCCTAGLALKDVLRASESFAVARERFEEFPVGDRRAVLMMTKQNSVSLDQSISYVLEQPGEKTVVLFINNVLYLDLKDISWLYDVSFERLVGKVNGVVAAGSRACDAAVRLKLAGFTDGDLRVVPELDKVCDAIDDTTGTIYILAASAFGSEDAILDVLRKRYK